MAKKRKRNKKKTTDSNGHTILKERGRTKPTMVERDITKYYRKTKHKKKVDDE